MTSAIATEGLPVQPAGSDRSPPTVAIAKSRLDWAGLLPFLLCHVAVLGALWSGVTWQAIAVGVALYWVRIFGVTAGYHRYFSHRAFETSRPFAFVLAFLAQSTVQKGVLWWASHHRHHHLYSDQEEDLHSPRRHGFLHAHVGWLFRTSDETDWARVRDLQKRPELVWLNRFHLVPPILLALAVWWGFGWPGLFIGFFASTVFTWHATFMINSLAHVWGWRRYATRDDSRNSRLLAFFTLGEGWHNNHHHYMQSARMGFFPGELDPTYIALRGLAALGLVWGLKEPPARVLLAGAVAPRGAR